MNKKFLVFVLVFVLLSISVSFVSASIPTINTTQTPAPFILDSDNFYYLNSTQNAQVTFWINISFNGSITSYGPGDTDLNRVQLNATCGALGDSAQLRTATLVSNTSKDARYNITCIATPIALQGPFSPGLVNFSVYWTPPGPGTVQTDFSPMNVIVLYNMTTPPSPPAESCTQFGPLTTNFANVPDFSRVNFVINIQANFTCLSEGRVNASTFRDVFLLNLTSVNLSTPEKAQKLQLLQSAMDVRLVAPHKHGTARIYINQTAFQEIDTNATIKFFLLPFTRLPTISADNPAHLNSSGFVSNGYDSALQIATVNLTITVTGFDGYTITDTNNPLITILSPTANTTNPSTVLSVRVNGTGTEPSQINIDFAGTTYYYNSTGNTAQCSNISSDKETYECTIGPIPLSDNEYTLTVNAWDYGGGAAPGNTNSSSFTFIRDASAPIFFMEPSVSPASGSAYSSSQVYQFNKSVTDGSGVGIQKVIMTFNGTNYTMTSAGNDVYTNSSIIGLARGTYGYIFWSNDTLGNNQFSDSYNYVVSQATPNLILTNNTALTVTYNNSINVTGTCPSGLVCNLSRNGVLLTSLSDQGVYGVGSYNYTFNTTGNQNYSIGTLTLNFTVNKATPTLTLTNYTALVVDYGNGINATGSGCPSQLTCLLYRNGTSTGGSSDQQVSIVPGIYTYVYNTTGNTNYTMGSSSELAFTVNKGDTSSSMRFKINGTEAGKSVTINTTLLINVTDMGVAGSGAGTIIVTNNGAIIYSGGFPYKGNFTNFTALGAYILTADCSGNENWTSATKTYIVSVYDPSYTSIINSSFIVSNQTTIIINGTAALQNITIPQGSNQTVVIDLATVATNLNVTIGAINVTVIRTDNTSGANYSFIIPANTNISGASGWDGKITLPTVNLSKSSFTAPSGTTNVVVEIGSLVELSFSDPVKIVIGGQGGLGRKAAWYRNSTSSYHDITACTSSTDHSNINTVSPRECYNDEGNDLVVWTYHFTSFAAYTPAPATITPPSTTPTTTTGCMTTWTCGDWGVCDVNNTQTRECTKVLSYCYAPEADKPYGMRPCTYVAPTGNQTITPSGNETAAGAKKEALTKKISLMVIGVIVLVVIVALIIMQLMRKKKFLSQ